MKLSELKKEIIGKKLKTIINLEVNESNTSQVRLITGCEYDYDVDAIQMMVFEDNISLAFVNFDCDGYRSGDWFLIKLEDLLDKGNTKDIKNINSVIRDIQYIENEEGDRKEYIMITTDEYIIMMGQNNVDDYYPSNFFDVEEAKEYAIKNVKSKGNVIELDK